MPHIQYNSKDLDELFPDLEVVDDLDFGDLSRLENDDLYAAGMREVQGILHEMSEIGRTREQFPKAHNSSSCISRDQHQVGEPHGLKEECKEMQHICQECHGMSSHVLSLVESGAHHLGAPTVPEIIRSIMDFHHFCDHVSTSNFPGLCKDSISIESKLRGRPRAAEQGDALAPLWLKRSSCTSSFCSDSSSRDTERRN